MADKVNERGEKNERKPCLRQPNDSPPHGEAELQDMSVIMTTTLKVVRIFSRGKENMFPACKNNYVLATGQATLHVLYFSLDLLFIFIDIGEKLPMCHLLLWQFSR